MLKSDYTIVLDQTSCQSCRQISRICHNDALLMAYVNRFNGL